MRRYWLSAVCLALLGMAQAAPLDSPPVLRLDAGGPSADVTALAFSPDGRTLYTAGFDKIVRVWQRPQNGMRFEPSPRAYRVPIGPGTAGTLNVLAVSPSGEWLAVSGLGLREGQAGFRDNGKVFPISALTPRMRRQQASIYLFQTHAPFAVKILRGHAGPVVGLAFAPAHRGKSSLLASVAIEPVAGIDRKIGRAILWNIDKATYRDAKGKLIEPSALLAQKVIVDPVVGHDVGLALQPTGPGVKQVRIAIAWGNGWLRTWDADTDHLATVQDVGFNHTAAYTSDGETLVTGGIDLKRNVARLQTWTGAAGRDPAPAAGVVEMSPKDDVDNDAYVPHALALLPAQEKGRTDTAIMAVLVRDRKDHGKRWYWLFPADLSSGRTLKPTFLWDYNDRLPVLAASADGRYVAVSGGPNHEVWIFAADALLRGQDTKQVLKNQGTVWRSLTFVERPGKNGQRVERALLLQQTPRPRADDLIADFTKRQLTPVDANQEWRPRGPADRGYVVTGVRPPPARSDNGTRWVIVCQTPQGAEQTPLTLDAHEQIDRAVLVPPQKPASAPLLAVATWDPVSSEPSLRLYRTDTGEQVRQYVGHGQRILALAVSADGKRLASSADDLTVRLWNLADVDDIVDRQGSLPGLAVDVKNGHLIVSKVGLDCPLRGKIQLGDTIDRLELDGKAVKLPTAVAFYDALWNQPRGRRGRLVIRHEGEQKSVPFIIGQGTDERHTLFSLFVPTGKGNKRAWIGWSPLGWFDASGPAAEEYVGWHFNPRQLEEPATFAPVGTKRYHDTFYRRGVLGRLLAQGQASGEADPPNIPEPHVSVVDIRTPTDAPEMLADNRYLVSERQVQFRLKVDGPVLDKRQIESIRWYIDRDGNRDELHDVDLTAGVGALMQTATLPAARGPSTILVELRTREHSPQVATTSCTLIYRRPPPHIVFAPDWLTKQFGNTTTRYRVVRNGTFTLQARLQPATGIQAAIEHNGQPVPPQLTGGRIHQAIQLHPGENAITLRVWNADAPQADRPAETATERFLLVYHPEPAPEIQLTKLGLGEDESDAVAIQPGQPLTVRTPVVHIHGRIKAGDEPPTITLTDTFGKPLQDRDHQPVKAAQPRRETSTHAWAIDQHLELRRERQSILFTIRSGRQSARAVLVVEYRPPLPDLELLAPANDATLTEGRQAAEIRPRIRFASDSETPFTVAADVSNDGKLVSQAAGKKSVTLSFNKVTAGQERELPILRIRGGQNRLRLVVSRAGEHSDPIERELYYRQPPRILRGQASPPATKPFTDLTATVASVSKPTTVRVEVNGRPIDLVRSMVVQPSPQKIPTTWTVRLNDVPTPEPKNTVRLWIGNADGLCLEPYTAQVAGMRPPANPPEVRITTPSQAVSAETAGIAFVVRSSVPLTAVVLNQPGEPPQMYKDLTMSPASGGGQELNGRFTVNLQEGANHFRIVADSSAGQGHDIVVLTRPETAVRMQINRPPAAVDGAEYRLHGRVTFRDTEEARRSNAGLQSLHVYVNEFLQRPILIDTSADDASRVRAWHVDLLLNRSENHIEVECPGLPLDRDRRQNFTVRCAKPISPATLHVLVVGVGMQDKDLLFRQAFRALQARPDAEQGTLRSPVFRQVIMHPYSPRQKRQVLYDWVLPGQVRGALRTIHGWIHTHETPNDVVLIYWTGTVPVRRQGAWYLPTSDRSPKADVAVKELLGENDDTPGARLLLLDVSSVKTVARQMPADVAGSHAGVLYYAWSQAEKPLQGLLLAVERSAVASRPITVDDIVKAARRRQQERPGELQMSDNVQMLPPLRGLILTRSTGQSP